MKDWVKIYATSQAWQAKLIEGRLNEDGISCVAMNKQDSAYLFGSIELYVPASDVVRAKSILEKITDE